MIAKDYLSIDLVIPLGNTLIMVIIKIESTPMQVKWIVRVNGKKVAETNIKLSAEFKAELIKRAFDAILIKSEIEVQK